MAQGVIGSLRVYLGLDSAKFQRGLTDAQKRLQVAAKRMQAVAISGAAVTASLVLVARRAADAIDAQAKLAQSLDTTVKSMQVMGRAGELAGVSMSGIEQATKDLTRRLSQAAANTGPAVNALKQLNLTASDLSGLPLDERIEKINSAIAEFVPKAQQAAVAGQLFGEEGSIAMSRIDPATIRQAANEIDRMGAAISEVDADRIEKANDQISKLGLISEAIGNKLAVTIVPALGAMADAMTAAFEAGKPLRQIVDILIENVGRLSAYVTAFAGVAAVRYVRALMAARIATLSLTGALTVLKVAILRTGIGAIVVAAGELVYQFSRLVAATGSFGSAMRAVWDVAKEVSGRVVLLIDAVDWRWWQLGLKIDAALSTALAGVVDAAVWSTNKLIGLHVGAVRGIIAAFSALPAAFSDIGAMIGDAILTDIERSLRGIVSGVNKVFDAVGMRKIAAPDFSEWKSGVTGLGDYVDDVVGVVSDSLSREYIPEISGGLKEVAKEAGGAAKMAGAFATAAGQLARKPLKSVQGVKDTLNGAGDAAESAGDSINKIGSAAVKAGGKVSKSLPKAIDKTKEKVKSLADVFREKLGGAIDSVAGAIGDFVSRGFSDFQSLFKSIGDSFKRLISQMIATSIANPIKIALGATGGVAGGVATGAAGGVTSGLLGGAVGSLGANVLGGGTFAAGTGLLGGFGAAVNATATSGITGLFSAGANAAAVGGGAMASIGAVAAPLLAVAAAFSFFKPRLKELDHGLQITIKNNGALTKSYRRMQKSRFWGLMKKKYTEKEAASFGVANPIAQQFTATRKNIAAMAASIGVAGSAFDSFTAQITFSTKKLTQDQIAQRIAKEFAKISDGLAGMAIDAEAFARAGETATQTLQRLSTDLLQVNPVMRDLGHSLYAVSVSGADMASDLVKQFGGNSNFASLTQSYFANYYTEAERIAAATENARTALAKFGLVLPANRDAYRQMVDAQQTMTAAGRESYAALLRLAPAMSDVFRAAEQQANAVRNEYRLDSAKYTTAVEAKLAHELATQATRNQDAITEQNALLKSQNEKLAQAVEYLRRQANSADDAQFLQQVG